MQRNGNKGNQCVGSQFGYKRSEAVPQKEKAWAGLRIQSVDGFKTRNLGE